jgi:hypothetical protein
MSQQFVMLGRGEWKARKGAVNGVRKDCFSLV